MNTNLDPAFGHKEYLFRRKFWKIFGGAFHVYDSEGNVVFYSEQKAFKLKEDFRIYSSETKEKELLCIKTPQILDIAAIYNVQDSTTGEIVGAIRRKGLKSLFRDEWVFQSKDGAEIGKLTEKSLAGALLSRFINLIPQKYQIIDEQQNVVAELVQHFNPFILKYTLKILDESAIDPRLVIAAGILLAGIEGRQQN